MIPLIKRLFWGINIRKQKLFQRSFLAFTTNMPSYYIFAMGIPPGILQRLARGTLLQIALILIITKDLLCDNHPRLDFSNRDGLGK